MTIIVAIITLLLVVGIVGAMVKRLFRLAVSLAALALLILGAAGFVIATMR